ncbi:glycosyltransferase [Candidatus Fermentibacteria bacterium]|nr:glycosyltransferase [Candidatus Fermentibacteria bacterium]
MRITEVYKGIYPRTMGGIERYIHDAAVYLRSRGHAVDVLLAGSRPGTRHFEVDDVPVTESPGICTVLSNPISPGLGWLMRRSNAELFHFHVPLPSAVLSWMTWRPGRKYVVTYHSDIVRQKAALWLYGPLLRLFLKGADTVLATSENYRKSSPYLSGLTNVEILPLGVDTERFSPGEGGEVGTGDYYLFVGRFREYKGIPLLLDAWKKLADRKLIMVGGGRMRSYIRKRIERERLPVSLRGDVSDDQLVELYRGARALLLPSTMRSEAFGMVLTEAMACGTPVIASNLPTGVSWVCRDGESGLSVPIGDVEALVMAVRKLDDPELRRKLSLGARNRVLAELDSRVVFERLEEVCLRTRDDSA